jgi:hypothetical protein
VAEELEFVFLRMEPGTGLVIHYVWNRTGTVLQLEPFKNHPILIRSFITESTMEQDMV